LLPILVRIKKLIALNILKLPVLIADIGLVKVRDSKIEFGREDLGTPQICINEGSRYC
jgi:hypothetical protein